MSRVLSLVLISSLLLGALGPECSRAVAQVTEGPMRVGAGIGWAGAGAVQTTFGTGPADFNDPRFFVLQTLSNLLTDARPMEPQLFTRSVETLLRAPEALSNPSSPRALAARVIAHALLNPGGVKLLDPTLQSIQPDLGASVSAKLGDAVRRLGGNPGAFESLARAVKLLDDAGSSGPNGQFALDRVFLGPLAGKSDEIFPAEGQPGITVYADGPHPSLDFRNNEAARLQPPSKSFLERLPADSGLLVRVWNLDAALALLRDRSVPDAAFPLMVRRLAELNGDLPLDERRTFLIRREPELLKLLKMPDTADGAARVLTDGRRSLSILIMAVPSRGRMSQREAAEVLLREARRAADSGIFNVPTTEPLSQLLREGYPRDQARIDRPVRAVAQAPLSWTQRVRRGWSGYLWNALICLAPAFPAPYLAYFLPPALSSLLRARFQAYRDALKDA